MERHLFTAAILIGALALYGIGLVSGALLLFAGGGALELWFWARVLTRRLPGHSTGQVREKTRAA